MAGFIFGSYDIFDLGYSASLTKEDSFYDQLINVGNAFDGWNPSNIDSGEFIGNFSVKDGYLQSSNYVADTTGWKIEANGDAFLNNLVLVGGTIRYNKTSFTDDTISGYYIGTEGLYMGDVSDATKFKFTIATGTLDMVGTLQTSETGKRVVISEPNNWISLYDASNILKGRLNGAAGNTLSARTIDSDFAAEFIKDDGASGDIADTDAVVQITNQGRGDGLVISQDNITANGANLNVSTNFTEQPRISMGSETTLPSVGTHAVGDIIVVRGVEFICVTAGTPGTFRSIDGNFYYGIAGETLIKDDWVGLGESGTTDITTIDGSVYVDEGNATTNYVTSSEMRVGEDSTPELYEGLLDFDISAGPAIDDLVSVKLYLYLSSNDLTANMTVGIRNITVASFNESTVTWNTKPATGTTYATMDFTTGSSQLAWYNVDITELYLQWKAGDITNYGISLFASAVSSVSWPSFLQFDSDRASGTEPYIEVVTRNTVTKLFRTDADDVLETYNVMGVATHTATSEDPVVIQCHGHYNTWAASTAVANKQYYLSDTEGDIETTPGTNIKPVARGISATEIFIDIQPGYNITPIELDGSVGAPDYQVGAAYNVVGFEASKVEIFASCNNQGVAQGWSHGIQIQDDASCQYSDDLANTAGQSTTLSYSAVASGTDRIQGDLDIIGLGNRIKLTALNTSNVNAFLTIKSFE